MKTILCYGDSNTYGYIPENGLRYPADVRWTGCLQNALGAEYRIIEEGCNGRTTVHDDPIDGWKNGISYLMPCLYSHKPVDIIILMLGSNDMKVNFNATADDAANGVARIIDIMKSFTLDRQGYVPQIILVSPPVISEAVLKGPFVGTFDEKSVSESRRFSSCYRNVADEKACIFADAAMVIEPSEVDGLHLSADSHSKLADALSKIIKSLE